MCQLLCDKVIMSFLTPLTCQAEKAAEEEAAAGRAAAKDTARPPTAMLGFAPTSHTSDEPQSATGKHSWPAVFFDSSRKRRHAAALGSENGSESSGAVQLESLGSGAESSHVTAAVEADGVDRQIGRDYGAAWRDAAHFSPAPASPPSQDIGAFVSYTRRTCCRATTLLQQQAC